MFVSDLIHHYIRCWNAPLINEIFLPSEAQQIVQLSISFSQLQDEFVWCASRSAIFSVKSSYHFLKVRREADDSHSSMQDNNHQVWKKIMENKKYSKTHPFFLEDST